MMTYRIFILLMSAMLAIQIHARDIITDMNRNKNMAVNKISLVDSVAVMPDNKNIYTRMQPGDRYYIITISNLIESFERLRKWKISKGYNVILTSLDSIETSDTIYDLPHKLRTYLKNEFKKNGSFYCLLAGDVMRGDFPVRKSYNIRLINSDRTDYEKNPNGDNYKIADQYFADLTSAFNLKFDSGSGIYVCSSSKCRPDIAVGRLLCSTPEEVMAYTDKLILYESNPGRGNPDYLSNSFFYQQCYKSKSIKDSTTSIYHDVIEPSGISAFSPEYINSLSFYNNKTLRYDNYASGLSETGPTGTELMEHMRGNGFCALNTHGCPVSFSLGINYYQLFSCKKDVPESGSGNMIDTYGLEYLNNESTPFILFGLGCSTTPLDIYEAPDKRYDATYNIAQSFTLGKNYGGPAYIGNTRDIPLDVTKNMLTRFLDNLNSDSNIGIAFWNAKSGIVSSDPQNIDLSKRSNDMNIVLIGDPEFNVWKNPPVKRNHDIMINDNYLMVQADDLRGAVISFNDGAGNHYRYKAIENHCKISDTANLKGGFSYSLWRNDCYPEIRFIGQNSHTEQNMVKDFLVINALMGENVLKGMDKGKFSIVNSTLRIEALDCCELNKGTEILDYGNLEIKAGNKVIITDTNIDNNGSVRILSSRTDLNEGSTIKKGGELIIYPNSFQ